MLTHRGRKTGRRHQAVIEVIKSDREAGVYYVASGWGEVSQWFRNTLADPRVRVTVGRRMLKAEADRLSVEDAERVLRDYRQKHSLAAKGLGRIFGTDDPHALAQAVPVVAFRRVRSGKQNR